jgi:chromosome segregation ATPase
MVKTPGKKELAAHLGDAIQRAEFHAARHADSEASRRATEEHSRGALTEARREIDELEGALAAKASTEKTLRSVATNLEQSMHATESELAQARHELAAVSQEWRLVSAEELAGMTHTRLFGHLEGVVEAIGT